MMLFPNKHKFLSIIKGAFIRRREKIDAGGIYRAREVIAIALSASTHPLPM